MKLYKIYFSMILIIGFGNANAALIGGVEFPDGITSFADSVVDYSAGTNAISPWNNPVNALGVPDYDGTGNTATSLGIGGWLTLQFTDNSLTTSGTNAADLWVFEIGGAVESFNVQISTNNIDYIDLGDISGQPSGIDIDAFIGSGVILGEQYSYVRLSDVPPNQSGSPFGEADIDAVGAISSAPPVNVPEPSILALMGLGIFGLGLARRKMKK